MKKKVLGLILAAVSVVSIVACGSIPKYAATGIYVDDVKYEPYLKLDDMLSKGWTSDQGLKTNDEISFWNDSVFEKDGVKLTARFVNPYDGPMTYEDAIITTITVEAADVTDDVAFDNGLSFVSTPDEIEETYGKPSSISDDGTNMIYTYRYKEISEANFVFLKTDSETKLSRVSFDKFDY